MILPFERMMACRYLRSKKQEGFVSVIAGFSFLGIMLGVATLIIVMSVMNGFRQELFDRILGLNGHMSVHALSGPLYDYDYLRQQIVPLEGVVDAVPIIEGQSLLSTKATATGVLVRGIAWEDFFNRPILRNAITAGDINDFTGNKVAIGSVLARKMRLGPGDELVLTAPKVKSTPFGSMPRQRSYQVAVVFDVEMYEYNSGFVFMPFDTAQKFFSLPGGASILDIFLENSNDLNKIRKNVENIVEGKAGVYDWRDTNQSFYNALKTERNVMFLILTLIIIVAAFNIISSMIMLVKDKGQDIAILRTMGATRMSMMLIFIMTGASIGLLGTMFGAILGIAFALNIESIRQFLEGISGAELFSDEIYFLSKLPADIDWTEVTSVIFMALILSVLATLYPAWRAARLDPVEALRYE